MAINVGDTVRVANIHNNAQTVMRCGVSINIGSYIGKCGIVKSVGRVQVPGECIIEFQDGDVLMFKVSELEVIK